MGGIDDRVGCNLGLEDRRHRLRPPAHLVARPVELRGIERRHLNHYHVHIDPVMHQFRPQAVGKPTDREFGAAIRRLQRYSPIAQGRADLYDRAAVARPHPLQSGHRAIDKAEIGHLGRAAVLFRRNAMKRGEDSRHRAIHPNVDGAEPVLDALGRSFDGIWIGNVERQRQRLSAEVLDLRRCGLQPLGPARDQHNLRPSRRKGMRRCAPDPRRCPGDYDRFRHMIPIRSGRPPAATHRQHSLVLIVPLRQCE